MRRPHITHRKLSPATTAAAAPAKLAVGFWPALVQAYIADPAAVLLSIGACVAAAALSVLLVAAVPALFALRRSAIAMEALMNDLRAEIPDTAAALRLSGLEIADAVEEVSAFGAEMTEGVRASARALVGAEQGLREGIIMAGQAMTSYVVPSVKKGVPKARG